MPEINLVTYINAPLTLVFDINRDVEMHMGSVSKTKERVVAGVSKGLLQLHDLVTWRARHLGIVQELTIKITQMKPYCFFEDTMTKGIFKSMQHQHFFTEENGIIRMEDIFKYESPLGILGKLADVLFLKRYMRNFLLTRNNFTKSVAEDKANSL